jgi:hypothetical protein
MSARVGPALYSVMEPGDEIVAGSTAQMGLSRRVDLAAALVGLSASVALGWLGWSGMQGDVSTFTVAFATSAFVFLGAAFPRLQFLRMQVFVAVTRRQLICYRLKFFGGPDRLMFAVPLPTGTVTCKDGSMTYTGPDGKRIRIDPGPHGRRDLGEVTAALQASGTIIEPAHPRALL